MKEALIHAAMEARGRAYAPYSNYPVGAAVLDSEGRVYSGCNVENASLGLSVCAERNAVAAMVLGGANKLRACAVVTGDGALPCGACLQTLLEFAEDPNAFDVFAVSAGGNAVTHSLSELLPKGFRK